MNTVRILYILYITTILYPPPIKVRILHVSSAADFRQLNLDVFGPDIPNTVCPTNKYTHAHKVWSSLPKDIKQSDTTI